MGTALKISRKLYMYKGVSYSYREVQRRAYDDGVRCLQIRNKATDTHIETIDLY